MWYIAIIALLLAFLAWMYNKLIAWKKWAKDYKQWHDDHCTCANPGGDPIPVEPDFP